MILCGTGHRPQKFISPSYTWDKVCGDMQDIAYEVLQQLPGDTVIISGMALGWDQELADVALDLNFPVWAYIPFKGQEAVWSHLDQTRYRHLLANCEKRVICSDGGYAAWKLQHRNERMVNDANFVLALWNGTPGGTGNCIEYANKKKVPIWNVYPEWSTGLEVIMPRWIKALYTK